MPKHTRNATRLATITTMAAAATLALAASGQSAAQPASGGETGAAKDTIVVAAVPAEESANLHAQFDGINKELEKATGKKVTFQQATDYAAIIEGQRAGNIHIASYGPSSFARARMTGAKVDAFAIETNLDGTKGYYSVFYVKKDSPYQKIEDLKGKNIGTVGAGGIGLHLSEQIRTLEWQHVSFLVLMVPLAVSCIDMISARLRFAIIGSRAH